MKPSGWFVLDRPKIRQSHILISYHHVAFGIWKWFIWLFSFWLQICCRKPHSHSRFYSWRKRNILHHDKHSIIWFSNFFLDDSSIELVSGVIKNYYWLSIGCHLAQTSGSKLFGQIKYTREVGVRIKVPDKYECGLPNTSLGSLW